MVFKYASTAEAFKSTNRFQQSYYTKTVSSKRADVPQPYLVARPLEDVAEASSADVICHLICDLKRVLK